MASIILAIAFSGNAASPPRSLLYFPCIRGDVKIPIDRRFKVERIDPEIVAASDNPVECLLVGEVERRFRDEKQRMLSNAFSVRRCTQPKLVGEGVRVFLDDAGYLLVNDLRGERHRSAP